MKALIRRIQSVYVNLTAVSLYGNQLLCFLNAGVAANSSFVCLFYQLICTIVNIVYKLSIVLKILYIHNIVE